LKYGPPPFTMVSTMGTSRRLLLIVCCLVAAAVPAASASAEPVGEIENFDVNCLVRGVVEGPDGNVWFSCERERPHNFRLEALLGRVTPQGEVQEFSAGLSQLSFVPEIVAGPDGNLWFPIDPGLNAYGRRAAAPGIGRITPGGQITEFREGLGANSFAGGLTAGPDGNVWFSVFPNENARSGPPPTAIGRITPSGQITEFREGLAPKGLGGLGLGPDGNLWFGDADATIKRIAPTGAITAFNSPTDPPSRGKDPVKGPDGNLWFIAANGTHTTIDRATPLGAIAEFTSASLVPGGIGPLIAGPDGNLWFPERGVSPALARITPNGQISEFNACLHGGIPYTGPEYLAAGPDGNVWFTNTTERSLPSIVIPAGVGFITPSGQITELRGDLAPRLGPILTGADGAMWFSNGEEIGRVKPFTGPPNTFRAASSVGVKRGQPAQLTITVPAAGTLSMQPVALLLPHRRKAKLPPTAPVEGSAGSCGPSTLRLAIKGRAKARLRRKHQVRLKVSVTFTPTGGTPNTQTSTVVVFRRR
jgi:streptogramin lyase